MMPSINNPKVILKDTQKSDLTQNVSLSGMHWQPKLKQSSQFNMLDLLQKIEQSRSPKNIEAAKRASGYTSLAAAKKKKDVERKVVKAEAVTLQHQESVSDMLNIKRLRRRDSIHSSLYSEHRGKSNMSSYKNLETRKDSQKAQFILSPVAGRKNVTSIQSNYADS
jgi:hypothetical protein